MKVFKLLPAVLFFLCIACSPQRRVKKINGGFISPREVDHIVRNLMDSAHVTGLGLALLNENEPVYITAYGYRNKEKGDRMSTDSIMAGASLSKAVFSYLVMQLVQENALSLDTPLCQYLDKPLPEYDDYRDLAADARWQRLTARICLSHTTGFPNIRLINPRGNGRLEFFFDPGSRYAYSGEGIKLLQFVVERISRQGLEELARERVFRPLGMNRTSFVWQERFAGDYALGHDISESPLPHRKAASASGSGSLLTTISDYAKFVEAVMKGRGLESSSRQAMLSPVIRIHSKRQFPTLLSEETDRYDAIALSYGLGWGLFSCPYGKAFFKEGHGNGWQNYNVNFPDQKTSIVIMTNSDNGERIFKDLLAQVIGDTFTPSEWEGYVPYYAAEPKPIGVYLYDILLQEGAEPAVKRYRQIKKSPARECFVFGEDQLHDLGRQMIKENKLDYALALFELNIEEYPGSARAYSSMGEICRLTGRPDRAIENYEKSLRINPQNAEAKEGLAELKSDRSTGGDRR